METPQQIQYQKEHASDDFQPNMIGCFVTGLVFSYLAVVLRCYARRNSKMKMGKDDLLIIAAQAFLTAYAIVGFCNISFGIGKHIILVKNLRGFGQSFVVSILTYALATVLTKTSILCFYCRLFPSRNVRRIAWAITIFTITYNLALILLGAFMCIPLSTLWTGKPGKCIDIATPQLILGIINVVTDVTILSIPVRYVLNLQTTWTRKVQICAIFLTGAIVCVFGILRCVFVAIAPSDDPTWNQAWSGLVSFCEMFVGVIAACLPTMGVILTKVHTSSIATSAKYMVSRNNKSPRRPTDSSLFNTTSNEEKFDSVSQASTVGGEPHVKNTQSQVVNEVNSSLGSLQPDVSEAAQIRRQNRPNDQV